MNPRGHMQPYLSNSLAIRQEIQRFESVHPSIYAIYDLIEAIPDPLIQQQIREHVVSIEDSFVNSQEWTLSRSVPDLKLGILGSISSGKSALVHRYLTGSYMQEESPEGGRFKKEVVIDGQSYLLLIRDEGGPPEMQFTHWVDAVIFVFSLENEMSFNAIYSYYAKMAHYRNTMEVPLILVGTQDAISESNPRVIDDVRARRLATDLKRCSYYETCATYGLNVERVFQDACQKIAQARISSLTPTNSRPSTPNHSTMRGYFTQQQQVTTPANKPYDSHSTSSQSTSGSGPLPTATPSNSSHSIQGHSPPFKDGTVTRDKEGKEHKHDKKHKEHRDKDKEHTHGRHMSLREHSSHGAAIPVPVPVPPTVPDIPLQSHPQQQDQSPQQHQQQMFMDYRDFPTPVSTPIASRKNKKAATVQKSNSFSGAAVLHRAMSQPNGNELPTPSSTPILGRKNKNKNITSDSSPEQPPLTPLLSRKEPRYRFSLIVDKVDSFVRELQSPATKPLTPILSRIPRVRSSLSLDKPPEGKDLPGTPSGTPTQSRKNRRRSNLFTQKKGDEDKKVQNGQLGSGRAIPIKQGHLYKKSSKPLNKEWKKKYVTLCDDGRLTYHPSLHNYINKIHGRDIQLDRVTVKVPGLVGRDVHGKDYMDDVHGKEIQLGKTTVKVPGMFKPRGARTQMVTNPNANGRPSRDKENVLLTAYDVIKEGATGQRLANCEDAVVIPNASIAPGYFNGMDYHGNAFIGSPNSKIETPNVKKRHKRAKSGTNKNVDPGADGDSDGYEFIIVSLENKQWHFEAPSVEEREEWVTAIEQQILSSLQCNESTKSKSRSNNATDPAAGQLIRNTKGNSYCADCDAPNPDWASLNLGALICIECSGIHRNLGTHLSRVRSLDLDEWPLELVTVMTCIGNTLANSIWEANCKGRPKPSPQTLREEKERYIRAKYEQKDYLPPPPYLDVPLSQQLIDAVARQDVHNAILVLAYSKAEHVNTPYSKTDTRTALHIAAALGNVVLVQLLLWYGADVKVLDHESRNALWYARTSCSQECVDLLRSQGCPDNPTLPRRRGSVPPGNNDMLEKLPASVI